MNNKLKLCRVCLQPDEKVKLIQIFDESNENNIAYKIFLLSGIQIEMDQTIPALICKVCCLDLSQAVRLKKLCIKSDLLFKSLLSETDSELWQTQINAMREYDTASYKQQLDIKTEPDSIDGSTGTREDYSVTEYLLDTSLGSPGIKTEVEFTVPKQPIKKITKKIIKKRDIPSNSKSEKKMDETALLCKLCNKYFTTPGSLKSHEKVTHHMLLDADLFSCDICHRVFKLKYYLSRHIRVVHLKLNMPKKKNVIYCPCSICGKNVNRSSLSVHEKTHRVLRAEDYCYCDLCGRKFKTLSELRCHINILHIKKIRYNCELCDKSYVKNTYLKLHIDSKHHHIRPYKCDHPGCVKTFDAKQKLAIHNRIHTGEKPHVCPFCDKRFIHQTDHKRHVMGHTGERPHKCNACGKGFIKRSELTAHDGRCHSTVVQPLQTFQYP